MRLWTWRILKLFSKTRHLLRNPFRHSRLKTPFLLQMEASECGAAALGIVLGYYGCYIPLEELRVRCGVSRDGSKAINMVKAARMYGLTAYGAQGETEALFNLKAPYIAFWRFNHFVVVEDIQNHGVYINDPAKGRMLVSHSEFDKSFTGVVIVLEPGPEFVRQGTPPKILNSIKERLQRKDDRQAIVFLMLISLGLIIPGLMIPGFSKIFIDDVLIKGFHHWLTLLIIGLALTALLRFTFSSIQQYYLLRFHLKWLITGSAHFFWHLFRLPITFFEQRYAGDLNDRLVANDRIANLLASNISATLVSLFSLVFFAIIMFLFDWQLTLIGLASSAVNAIVLYFIYERISVNSQRFLQDSGKLSGLETYGLRSIETLKASGLENHFFKLWAGNHARLIDTQQNIALSQLILSALPSFFMGLSTVLILAVGSQRIISGALTVGTLIAFQSLLASFNAPINTLLGIAAKMQEIRGDIRRIDDVLHQKEDVRFFPTAVESKAPSNNENISLPATENLVMKNVTFGYSTLAPPIIEDFNLSLKAGQQLAIVGATGSGKTTIVKLITGLYQSWEGEIIIEGKPIQSLTPEVFASIVGLVDQDIILFEGTIRNNLSLWNNTIPRDKIEKALAATHMMKVLEQHGGGLETKIKEGGSNFSGGEQQRLEIARALIQEPKILILDEGTSSLDSVMEQKILSHLRQKGHTLIMITHRLTTIRESDHIIVMDKGRIVEEGTHEPLLSKNGLYASLINNAL